MKTDFIELKNVSRVVLIGVDRLNILLYNSIFVINEIPVDAFRDIFSGLLFLEKFDNFGDVLIFLDIEKLQKSGYDFLDYYRKFKIKSKVIILSSYTFNDEFIRIKNYEEIIDYVKKPLTFNYLQCKFNMVLKSL